MQPAAAESLSHPRNLLVRGVNWLGDAVMTTPALTRIREALPGTRITLLTAAKLADLWTHHPAVDDVVRFTSDDSPWAIGRRLRERNHDAALIFPNSPRSALECWLARIPRRIGHARSGRSLLLTDRIANRPGATRMHKPSVREIRDRLRDGIGTAVRIPPPESHQLHEYLHLAAVLGASDAAVPPRLVVTTAETEQAKARFGLHAGSRWLALNPGAEYGPAKRWPAERFAAVAATLEKEDGVRWILLGGPNDRETTAAIAAHLNQPINLAGRTSLRELMAVLACCRALLSNDTGPMHVGAALGLPVIVPFGSTSPELTGPGMPGDARHRLLRTGAPCAPCFLRECPIDFRCLKGLQPEVVTAAIREVLTLPVP